MNERPVIDAAQEKILSLAQETRFAPNGIVSRTLLRTPHGRVVLFGFTEGQELTEHTSTQHALIQILSGECEFALAGKPHPLKAGDLLYLPPNLPHAVKATAGFSMLLTLSKPEAARPAAMTSPPLPAVAERNGSASTPPLSTVGHPIMNTNATPSADSLIGPDRVMDVRLIPCSVKHGLILKTWVELPVGEHFILLNDHDPVPLFHQFNAEWPGAFTWEHLAKRAEEVRVKITKLRDPRPRPATACGCAR